MVSTREKTDLQEKEGKFPQRRERNWVESFIDTHRSSHNGRLLEKESLDTYFWAQTESLGFSYVIRAAPDLLVRQAWDWDPLLQCLYLDTPLLQQQNTKKLHGTKNNCVHVPLGQIHWSKFWTQRIQRDQKPQPPFLRSLGQKQGFGEQNKRTMQAPCTRRGGQTT